MNNGYDITLKRSATAGNGYSTPVMADSAPRTMAPVSEHAPASTAHQALRRIVGGRVRTRRPTVTTIVQPNSRNHGP